jgi:hypothetical protein
VLGVVWTGKISKNLLLESIQADLRKKPDSERIVLTYPVGQKLTAKKESKASKFDLLINKKVYICDNLIKGVSVPYSMGC